MSANVSIIELTDGRTVCLSYGVPVAVFVPKGIPTVCDGERLLYGVIKTSRRYSVTSSRHANAFARECGATVSETSPEMFALLVAPLTIPR